MARKLLLFDSFKGGEFGQLGAWNAPKDSFTANNMLVNQLGELMVRPGLIKRNPSGLANGVVHGFGNTPVPLNDLWFIQGTAVRTFGSDGTNLKTSATALAETPSQPVDWKTDTTSIVIASALDKLYRISPQGGVTLPTVAGLTGSPGASTVEVYGDRVMAGNIDGSFPYRLRFSDAANPNSWPAANFIDIGDGFGITGLYSQRQHLLLAKQSSFHVLTGVPGVNDVLRKVAAANGPLHPLHARMTLDRLWYQHLFAAHPSTFNGSLATELFPLDYTNSLPNQGGAGAFPLSHGLASINVRSDGAVFVSDAGDRAALFLNGVWTFHTFGVGVSGYVASNGQNVYLCDGAAAGATPNFYVWDPVMATPGIEGGGQSRAGDDTSTALAGSVTFPEWWATDGAEVFVRAVIVDFRKFNTGSATTNHFDLTVDALRRYQAGAAQPSSTVSFDEAAAASSASGTLERRVFGFGEQGRGNGLQIAFAACRGIAIQRIEVVLDSEPARL